RPRCLRRGGFPRAGNARPYGSYKNTARGLWLLPQAAGCYYLIIVLFRLYKPEQVAGKQRSAEEEGRRAAGCLGERVEAQHKKQQRNRREHPGKDAASHALARALSDTLQNADLDRRVQHLSQQLGP